MSGTNGSVRNWGQSAFELSFDEVQDSVRLDDTGKWDHILPRTDLTMRDGHLTFAFDQYGEHRESLMPTSWALRWASIRARSPMESMKVIAEQSIAMVPGPRPAPRIRAACTPVSTGFASSNGSPTTGFSGAIAIGLSNGSPTPKSVSL